MSNINEVTNISHKTEIEFSEAVTEAMQRVYKAVRIGWQYNQHARPNLDEFAAAVGKQLLDDAGCAFIVDETPW